LKKNLDMETSTGCVDTASRRNGFRRQQGRFQIIPFRPRHVRLILPDATDSMITRAEYAVENGFSYTACLLGTPIGAAGMCFKEANTAELWAMFTPLFKSMPITLYRAVREKYAEAMSKAPELERIYAIVDPRDETAIRFVQHLGLKMTNHVYEVEVKSHG